MKRYFIRALKSVVLFFILAMLLFAVSFVLGNSSSNPITFMDLLQGSDLSSLVIFGVVFGVVYPLFGYVKRKVYTNHPLDEEKQEVIRLFAEVRFELQSDNDKKLIFRHKNPVARFMRLCEDRIEIDYSDNPVLLSGLRRDIDRLASRIQKLITSDNKL
ncbi:MAG: hypothetical protein LBT49_00730 [Prevotellaceae bacterium]|jgi:hypothetical protein|nr:hypothetical protein [Prevotellaceae bacterium]